MRCASAGRKTRPNSPLISAWHDSEEWAGGGSGFPRPLMRAASDAGGCFQPASRCHQGRHWSAAAKPPSGSFSPGHTVLGTARGMCLVLFLCVGLKRLPWRQLCAAGTIVRQASGSAIYQG